MMNMMNMIILYILIVILIAAIITYTVKVVEQINSYNRTINKKIDEYKEKVHDKMWKLHDAYLNLDEYIKSMTDIYNRKLNNVNISLENLKDVIVCQPDYSKENLDYESTKKILEGKRLKYILYNKDMERCSRDIMINNVYKDVTNGNIYVKDNKGNAIMIPRNLIYNIIYMKNRNFVITDDKSSCKEIFKLYNKKEDN